MPRLSMIFVRASLIYLAIGFTLGAILLSNEALNFSSSTWRLLPIHIEVLLIGWFVQLAAGVAFWILPRLSGQSPRGNERLVGLSFCLVNLGIWMAISKSIFSIPALLVSGRLVETAGVLAFVTGSWKRVKGFAR